MALWAVALLVPAVWAVSDAAERTKTDTRVVAHRWVVEHVDPGVTIAAESSTPALPDGYLVVPLELPGPGRPADPSRDYRVLVDAGVRYAFVTGAVADRVMAAADSYPREAALYDDLRTKARRVLYVADGGALTGPWVALYEL